MTVSPGSKRLFEPKSLPLNSNTKLWAVWVITVPPEELKMVTLLPEVSEWRKLERGAVPAFLTMKVRVKVSGRVEAEKF
jgi:hypothetical protein